MRRISGVMLLVAALAADAHAKTIDGRSIKKSSLSSRQIKDGSIQLKDLAPSLRATLAAGGPTGPAGPRGADGAPGVPGEKGEKGDPGEPAPVYAAGPGLKLNALEFSLDTAFAQRRVAGACATGSAIRAIAENGTVTCEIDDAGAGSGDVSAVTPVAGSGLTGGGTAGDLTIGTDANVLQKRIATACAAGKAISAVAATGAPTCAEYGDVSGVTPVAGSGLTGGGATGALTIGTDTNVLQKRIATACAAGQAMTAVAATGTPTCAAFGDITGVTAGAGLAGGGTTGSPSLSVAVPLKLSNADNVVAPVKGLNSGTALTAKGVEGEAPNGLGVRGSGIIGVQGDSTGTTGRGLLGNGYAGVEGVGSGYGVIGVSQGTGVYAEAGGTNAIGLYAYADGTGSLAGKFTGDVQVYGTLTKSAGTFRIDHPQDPANKTLSHSFVESPEMKNVYDGVVRTDRRGFATIRLPGYFDALNRDFRYQLTVHGRTFAKAIVWEEIRNNRFVVRTDEPRVKLSWQVTGIRDDAYARTHPTPVEQRKTGAERGRYLNPEAFGLPASKGIGGTR